MFSPFDARKSWQKATKFREHLSFISTGTQQQPPPKSAWSPITPSDTNHHFTLMSTRSSVPPVPPIPAIHAAHLTAPTERDPDEQRSIERARAEAAAALERGSRERQAERERLDRERQLRLIAKDRQQQATSFFDDAASAAPSTFTAKSKAALSRLSHAVFRFTRSPAAEPAYPFPRDSFAASSSYIPRRLSDLAPWPPLNVQHDDAEYQPAPTHSRSHSRADSETMAGDHVHVHRDLEKGGRGECPSCRSAHRKSRVWCILLMLLVLALIGNVVFLNVRVLSKNTTAAQSASSNATASATFNPSSSPNAVVQPTTTIPSGVTVTRSASATISASASSGSSAPAAVSSCLSQFSSTSSPASYPCSQCVPILSAIPNDFTDDSGSTSVTGQGAVLQFCALQSMASGVSALTGAGWLKDTDPCEWSGVTCDSKGRVSTLELVAPAVPTTLPGEMQFLVGLVGLNVTGDNSVPSGSLSPILTLTSLKTLALIQTGLQASLTDQTTLSTLTSLTSLTLSQNAGITITGSSLAGTTGMSLTSLILTGQSIPANTLSLLTASTSAPISSSLTVLSLANSNQAGSIPTALPTALPNLVELRLDDNAYSSLSAGAGGLVFPSGMGVVSLKGNDGMTGSISSAECAALSQAKATSCDFSGTSIALASGVSSCAPCVFGSL